MRMVHSIEITGTAQKSAWDAKRFPALEEVRPGLWSIPIPIPDHPVRYTLCYAFLADTGVLLVDPGWASPESALAMRQGLRRLGADFRDVVSVIATHAHVDHFGLATQIQAESRASLLMHPADAVGLGDHPDRQPDHERPPVEQWGVPAELRRELSWDWRGRGKLADMPDVQAGLVDGARVTHGSWVLEVLATPGHTPGHVCLYVPAADVLLTGDHVLPRISPNVSDPAWHVVPSALESYLQSLASLEAYSSAEVLPAHEYRFRGLSARIADLVQHHFRRGAELLDVLASAPSRSTWEIASRLSWSRGWENLDRISRRMALGETAAHLNYLRQHGQIRSSSGASLYHLVTSDEQVSC